MCTRKFLAQLAALPWLATSTFGALPSANLENSWTKPTSGYWEEPYWSLGQLPSYEQGPIILTNGGWKALAIGSSTTINYPDSLHIQYLTIDAPPDSRNLLLLNYAGLSVPLNATGISIGTNGSLLSYYSAVEAGTIWVNGTASFAEYGQSRFGQVQLGESNPAELNLSNGWFSAREVVLARGAAGTFNQSGGSNQVSEGVWIKSDGAYNLSGGTLNPQFIDMYGPPRIGRAPRLNIMGGVTDVHRGISLSGSQLPGEMLLSGGVVKSEYIRVDAGGIAASGGTNQTGLLTLLGGAAAGYTLSGGRLNSGKVEIGEASWGAQGAFVQTGGVHSNSESIILPGTTFDDVRSVLGTYSLSSGVLSSPTIAMAGGHFDQSDGTNYVQKLWLTNGGSYTLSSGTLVGLRADIENYTAPAVRPRVVQIGGQHRLSLRWLESGGVYELRGGVLAANDIYIGAGTQLRLGAGVVSSNNLIEINGGPLFLDGNQDLGWLEFNGDSHIDFQTGSSIVRFTGVGYPPPALDGELWIHNWKGSTKSPGRDQMYITVTDQYTPSRIRSMMFIDPYGFPPGHYPARMKPSGEVVPLEPSFVTYSRRTNGLLLSWPEGYQLYTSTNVAGPYRPFPNATNPRPVSFTDPRRFFKLSPAP